MKSLVTLVAVVVSFCVCGCLCSSQCRAQVVPAENQQQPESPILTPVPTQKISDGTQGIEQAVIDDIDQIRRQLGGGIAEQLNGLELEQNWKATNGDPRAGRAPNSRVQSHQTQPQKDNFLNGEFNHELKRLVSQSASGRASSLENSVSSEQALTPSQCLRESARRLEGIAAELEEAKLYAEADNLRSQARDFWLKARNLGQSHSPKD